jgi:hypothetical protein
MPSNNALDALFLNPESPFLNLGAPCLADFARRGDFPNTGTISA